MQHPFNCDPPLPYANCTKEREMYCALLCPWREGSDAIVRSKDGTVIQHVFKASIAQSRAKVLIFSLFVLRDTFSPTESKLGQQIRQSGMRGDGFSPSSYVAGQTNQTKSVTESRSGARKACDVSALQESPSERIEIESALRPLSPLSLSQAQFPLSLSLVSKSSSPPIRAQLSASVPYSHRSSFSVAGFFFFSCLRFSLSFYTREKGEAWEEDIARKEGCFLLRRPVSQQVSPCTPNASLLCVCVYMRRARIPEHTHTHNFRSRLTFVHNASV